MLVEVQGCLLRTRTSEFDSDGTGPWKHKGEAMCTGASKPTVAAERYIGGNSARGIILEGPGFYAAET